MAGLVAMSLLEDAVFGESGVVSGARFQKLKFRDEDELPLPGSVACPVARNSLLSPSPPWWNLIPSSTSYLLLIVL